MRACEKQLNELSRDAIGPCPSAQMHRRRTARSRGYTGARNPWRFKSYRVDDGLEFPWISAVAKFSDG